MDKVDTECSQLPVTAGYVGECRGDKAPEFCDIAVPPRSEVAGSIPVTGVSSDEQTRVGANSHPRNCSSSLSNREDYAE